MRFVWGRTKLPLPGAQNCEHHQININENKSPYPTSKTCVFTIFVPKQSLVSDEFFREKLTYSIQCLTMDGDKGIQHAESIDEPEEQAAQPVPDQQMLNYQSEDEG